MMGMRNSIQIVLRSQSEARNKKKRERNLSKQINPLSLSYKNALQIEPRLKYVTSTGALAMEFDEP
jgi:hypothetical protein